MKLEEMKAKVLLMIEEYNEDEDTLSNDEDIGNKLNTVINQIQNELARYKKISAFKTIEVEKDQEILLKDIDERIYQLNVIKNVDYDPIGDTIIFNEDGTAKIYYYRYPTQINQDTDDDYEFELTTDLLEIMPYGVAGDILKSDVSESYGNIYANRYKELLNGLDPRTHAESIYIEGGVDI